VHDGTVRLDRSPDDFIVVLEVDDDDLGLFGFAESLTYADEVIGF